MLVYEWVYSHVRVLLVILRGEFYSLTAHVQQEKLRPLTEPTVLPPSPEAATRAC